jgi:low-affinity inorganic phosphate transporter
MLTGIESYDSLVEQRGQLRRIMLCISDTTDKVAKLPEVNADDQRLLKKLKTDMLSTIEYAPIWIIMAGAGAGYRHHDRLASRGDHHRREDR